MFGAMKSKEKTAKARQDKETNPRVLRMYATGRFIHLTPTYTRTDKRGAKKPKVKNKR